jgi:hypothetical protein
MEYTMKNDLLDAKIKGIASGTLSGIELYDTLLDLEASGRTIIHGEIIDYQGMKAVLATQELSKTYPYLNSEKPILFPFSKEIEVVDLGNGFFEIKYEGHSSLDLGGFNQRRTIADFQQSIAATDPRIGHKRGSPYPGESGWWLSRREEASNADPMCYGPYLSLDAGVYDFYWEVELVSQDLAGPTDWGDFRAYGFCGVDIVWNAARSPIRTLGAIFLDTLPQYESPVGSGIFRFLTGFKDVRLEVPLPDVECRLYNGWYGRVSGRGNPYRVNLTAKRLVVNKVG